MMEAAAALSAAGADVAYARGAFELEYEDEPVGSNNASASATAAPSASIKAGRSTAAAAAAAAAGGAAPAMMSPASPAVVHHSYAADNDDDGDDYDEDEDEEEDGRRYAVGAGSLASQLDAAAVTSAVASLGAAVPLGDSEHLVLVTDPRPGAAPGATVLVRASVSKTEEFVPPAPAAASISASRPVSACGALCARADALAEAHDYEAVWALLTTPEARAAAAGAATGAETAEVLWRAARGAYHTSKALNKAGDAAGLRARVEAGHALALEAGAADDDSVLAHKWAAVLGSEVGGLGGQQGKIDQAFKFQQHVQRALALAPADADLHHMMGRFCVEIAGVGWTMRKVAEIAFGGLPKATVEDGLEHFRLARQGEPAWPLNLVWMGRALRKLGRTAEAEELFAEALALPAVRLEDEEAHAMARKELESM